jgi:hypothetical protein
MILTIKTTLDKKQLDAKAWCEDIELALPKNLKSQYRESLLKAVQDLLDNLVENSQEIFEVQVTEDGCLLEFGEPLIKRAESIKLEGPMIDLEVTCDTQP